MSTYGNDNNKTEKNISCLVDDTVQMRLFICF